MLGLGDLDAADKAYKRVARAASGRTKVAALMGLAQLGYRNKKPKTMGKKLKSAVEEAVKLGPVTYANTLLEAGLLNFQANIDASKALKAAVVELSRLGFDGSVALATIALMRLGHQPHKGKLSHYLEALAAPRYSDEVTAAASWLIPACLALFQELSEPDHKTSLLRLFNLYPTVTAESLGHESVSKETKLDLLAQLSKPGSPLPPPSVLEALALDSNSEVSMATQKLQASSSQASNQVLIRCRSFGAFEVFLGQEPIPDKEWRTKKVRYYFAYLAGQWGSYCSEEYDHRAFLAQERPG